MADLSDARIASPHLIKLAPARPLFDQVRGMVLSRRVPLWMPKAAQADLESRIEEGMSEQKAVAALLRAGKGAIDYLDWQKRLQAAGVAADGVEAIDLLLRGRTKASATMLWPSACSPATCPPPWC